MSTTVSKLLQITAAPQGASKTGASAKGDGSDFLEHLQTASKSREVSASDGKSTDEPSEELNATSSQSSSDRETTRKQPEADATVRGTETEETESVEEVGADSEDSVELSDAIVAYLSVSDQNSNTAVIEISQDTGVVVTQADEAVLLLEESGSSVTGSIDELAALTHQTAIEDSVSTGNLPFTDIDAQSEQASELQLEPTLIKSTAVDADALGAAEAVVGTGEQQEQTLNNAVLPAASAQESDAKVTVVQQAEGQSQFPEESEEQAAAEIDVTEEATDEVDAAVETESKLAEALEQKAGEFEQQAASVETKTETGEQRATNQEASNPIARPDAAESKPVTESTGTANTTASDPEPVPTGDRVRFVQRVSRAFQSARPGSNEIQLKLSPPELGTLRMSISVEQGVVSAKVETETAAARNILLDNLPALRERLAEQEIRVEKFDVDVGRDGQQNDQQSQFTARDRESGTETGTAPRRNTHEATTVETSQSTPSPEQKQVVTDSSLDVSI